MNNICQDILKTLAYFDYFDYPLTCDDIQTFLPRRSAKADIDEMLTILLNENIIFKIDDFYSLKNEPLRAKRRSDGNRRAAAQLVIAKKVARMLSRCPYVQTVAVSGSLSKHFADENADIDFFIITSANRLWIARSCMHFLKKLSYIAGRQNWFCMNYYVDEMSLNIPEKNIFTAMEIATLLPMQGATHFKNFIAANAWINNYFPANTASAGSAPEIKKGFIRKCFEKIFNSSLGDTIDTWLMNITDKRWRNKTIQGKVNDHGARIGMVVHKHFSKPDPKNFQAKVVEQYENKVKHLLESNQPIDVPVFLESTLRN